MVIFIQQVSHKFHQYRSSRPEVFYRKGVPQVCNFIKKETLAQVFSREFCEISKNNFFHRTPPVVASVNKLNICQRTISISCSEFITLYQNILPTVSSDQIKFSLNVGTGHIKQFLIFFYMWDQTFWIQDRNWTYIRCSEDVMDVFWRSYIRSINFLYPGRCPFTFQQNKQNNHILMKKVKSCW